MIDELRARDVALIRDATIRPAPGLTVLTGETGAGKTALLSALKLLVGERADAGAVREGSDALEVEGRVFAGPADTDGTVVRRRVGADGRGRVEIDGRMASVRELAEQVGSRVDLCGQHEHQRLLSVASHVELLDAFAGERALSARAIYRDAFIRADEAAAELERVREMSRAGAERLDEARFIVGRIDEVSPKEGELEQLEEALPRAEHAEALLMSVEEAREALVGEESASAALSAAQGALRSAANIDPTLEETYSSLDSALIEIEDAAATLRDYRDGIELDPAELARMQERMGALNGLLRSYGPSMADVFSRREAACELIEAAGEGGERVERAEAELARAEEELASAAAALDAIRREAAPELTGEITAQMQRLEMAGAAVELEFTEQPREAWTQTGATRVEMLYRPGEKLGPRPLRKIASGGEVSRVMLACKVVLGEADEVETLVFDEVDAGVGGATAVALAGVIADLARTHQVIVVTHLAQVAVTADVHYVVERMAGEVPETRLFEVEGDERVAEIARMLSGDATTASLEHAREMLAEHATTAKR